MGTVKYGHISKVWSEKVCVCFVNIGILIFTYPIRRKFASLTKGSNLGKMGKYDTKGSSDNRSLGSNIARCSIRTISISCLSFHEIFKVKHVFLCLASPG